MPTLSYEFHRPHRGREGRSASFSFFAGGPCCVEFGATKQFFATKCSTRQCCSRQQKRKSQPRRKCSIKQAYRRSGECQSGGLLSNARRKDCSRPWVGLRRRRKLTCIHRTSGMTPSLS